MATIPEPRRSPRRLLHGAVLMAALALGWPASISAQREKPYALIFVTAYDSTGHSAYGLQVRIRRADKKKPAWEGFTDRNGEFAQRISPGPADYIVWLEDTANRKPDKHALAEAIAAAEKGPAHATQEGSVRATWAVKVHIAADERLDIGFHPQP